MAEKNSGKLWAITFALIALWCALFFGQAMAEQNGLLIPMKNRNEWATEEKGPFADFQLAFRKEISEKAQEKADCLQGRIKKIDPLDGPPMAQRILGTLLVEGKIGNEIVEAAVRITTDTQIFKEGGEKTEPGSFGDLKVGQWIWIKPSGPILQTHPVQAEAEEIRIFMGRK